MAVVKHPGAMVATGGSSPFQISAPRKTQIRRVAGKVAAAAMAEKHTVAAVAAAGALGLLERNNVPVPYLEFLGKAGSMGALAWIAGKYTGNVTVQHVATGLLSVAAYELAKGGAKAGGVAGDSEVIMGEI